MKLFVTVGSMLPFDRLVRCLDEWAGAEPSNELFAQIGQASYRPKYMAWQEMLTPSEYRERFKWCDLIVSHVGMGTVITAAEVGRPLLMLPRRMELAEVTSNHQTATAKWLIGKAGVRIVQDELDLPAEIRRAVTMPKPDRLQPTAASLIDGVRCFVNESMPRN